MPVYWEDDEEGKEQARVELYESPPPKRDFGRYILMMVTAAVTALIVSC